MLRSVLFSLFAIPAIALAQSSNIDLFSFVMADAQLIAGIHVDSAKSSPFGEFVLARIPAGEKFLQGFMTATGIDPRTDVSEIVAAWNGAPNANGRWVIGAHGAFGSSIETIEVTAMKDGGNITRLPGLDLIATGQRDVCLAIFTDGFTDVAGDCTSVQSAVQFGLSSAGAASAVALRAQQLRAKQDLWFASVVPIAQFTSGAGPRPANLDSILKNNLFQSIQQISGGVKFAEGAQLSAEVLMDSPQNATSLLNVVNFLSSMVQMNSANIPPAAGGLVALLSQLQATVEGSTLNIALNIPESGLEQLFAQLAPHAL